MKKVASLFALAALPLTMLTQSSCKTSNGKDYWRNHISDCKSKDASEFLKYYQTASENAVLHVHSFKSNDPTYGPIDKIKGHLIDKDDNVVAKLLRFGVDHYTTYRHTTYKADGYRRKRKTETRDAFYQTVETVIEIDSSYRKTHPTPYSTLIKLESSNKFGCDCIVK